MKYRTILKSILPILLLWSFFSYGQHPKERNEDMVKAFFKDVFISNKPLHEISDTYRYKSDKPDAREMFINHIKYLKSEKEHLKKEAQNIKVHNYKACTLDNLWLFEEKEQNNIYVVSLNDTIEWYVLLKNSKIVSFVYLRKGRNNPGSFIPYDQKLGK